jgi:hypothetical protein
MNAMNWRGGILKLAALALSLGGLAAATEGLHDNCDSIEPLWRTTEQNGGIVRVDEQVKQEGAASIRFDWEPQPAVAADGTASVQQKPERSLALCWIPSIKAGGGQKYRLKYWLRSEGDVAWNSETDLAVLKVEVWWHVPDAAGKDVVRSQFQLVTQPTPTWTEVTDFITHHNSDPSFAEVANQPTAELTAPAGTTHVSLRFIATQNSRTAKFWIDDVRFEPVQ